MGLALQQDRPAWSEVVGVLVACAILLVIVVKIDHAAATRENERARAALAERAREARERPPEPASAPVQPARRTESLGDRGPITIPLGGAWGAGTASTVGRTATRSEAVATPELRRIVGPTAAAESTPVKALRRAAPAAATAAERPLRTGSLVLFLVAGAGAAMALSGALILTRAR